MGKLEDEELDVEILDDNIGEDSPRANISGADSSDGEIDLEVVDPFAARKEGLKEARNQLLALRKSLKNADKKSKKDLQDQLSLLEQEVEAKRISLENDQRQAAVLSQALERARGEERITRMKAKREARRAAEIEKEKKMQTEAAEMAALIPRLGQLEKDSLGPILLKEDLEIFEIAPDGNCLFNALVHQLQFRHQRAFRQEELRSAAAERIASESEKYAAFLEEPIEEYCQRIRAGEMWGGHLEIDALSNFLSVPIIVYQSGCEPLKFGENFPAESLRICFQKFAYTLGEHYDSLIDASFSITGGTGR